MEKAAIFDNFADWRRTVFVLAAFLLFAAYVAIATMATLFIPAAIIVFLAPFILIAAAKAPEFKAAPKKLVMVVLFAGAAMMPLWPVYIHLKLGPAPIITPPRMLLYAVTAFWLYDMCVSRLRRGQFLLALKKSPHITGAVLLLFLLNMLSIPLAHGSAMAAQEFLRQVIIWLIPFCAFATYVRRFEDLRRVLAAAVIGAAIAGVIAVVEFGSGRLLAGFLSPFISGDAEWLRIAQEQKVRDGVFRAQATHTHPLSLGEFLALAAPLSIGFSVGSKGRMRTLWALAFLVIIAGMIATNSRGAVVAIFAGIGLTGGILFWRVTKAETSFRFRPAIGLASLFLIAASPAYLYVGHKIITGDAGTSAARSSQSRIDQIEKAWPKIMKRPVLGYGTGRAARIIGYWGRTLSVDNYYLSLAVETGLPGPITFLFIMIFSMRSSLRGAKHSPPDREWILVGFAGAMLAFATSRSIISQTGNLSLFYPLIGAYVGAAVRWKAPSATPLEGFNNSQRVAA